MSSAYSLSSHEAKHLLSRNVLALLWHCASLSHGDIGDKVPCDITFDSVGTSYVFLISKAWALVQTSFGRTCLAQ